MELYQLRTFIAVVQEGHLTRAAKRLHLSQPAVSAHIKALEDELSVALFARTPKGMKLTPEGEILKANALQVLASADDLRYQAATLGRRVTGLVRVGLHIEPHFLRITKLFVFMHTLFPGISLHFTHGMSWELIQEIKAEELDAGFVYGHPGHAEITGVMLHEFTLCIAGPPDWGERIHKAGWREIAAMPWIWSPAECLFTQIVSPLFEKEDLEPEKVAVADQEAILATLVSSGVGLAPMIKEEAEALAAEGRVAIWPEKVGTVPLTFAFLTRRQKDPVVQAVLRGVREVWG
jgi:DNA-binding transcriptional LysR family regulator